MLSFAELCTSLAEAMNNVLENIDAINSAVEESVDGITMVASNTSELAMDAKGVNAEADGVKKIVGALGTEVSKFQFV